MLPVFSSAGHKYGIRLLEQPREILALDQPMLCVMASLAIHIRGDGSNGKDQQYDQWGNVRVVAGRRRQAWKEASFPLFKLTLIGSINHPSPVHFILIASIRASFLP